MWPLPGAFPWHLQLARSNFLRTPPQPSDPSGCPECLEHGEAPFQELCPTLESPQSSGLPLPFTLQTIPAAGEELAGGKKISSPPYFA